MLKKLRMKIIKARFRNVYPMKIVALTEREALIDVIKKIYPEVEEEDESVFFDGCKTEEEKVIHLISATNISAELPEILDDGTICIRVIWGDWKHDHGFLDSIMMNMGYKLTDEEVTEEDGSDCYSSIHFYKKGEN